MYVDTSIEQPSKYFLDLDHFRGQWFLSDSLYSVEPDIGTSAYRFIAIHIPRLAKYRDTLRNCKPSESRYSVSRYVVTTAQC